MGAGISASVAQWECALTHTMPSIMTMTYSWMAKVKGAMRKMMSSKYNHMSQNRKKRRKKKRKRRKRKRRKRKRRKRKRRKRRKRKRKRKILIHPRNKLPRHSHIHWNLLI